MQKEGSQSNWELCEIRLSRMRNSLLACSWSEKIESVERNLETCRISHQVMAAAIRDEPDGDMLFLARKNPVKPRLRSESWRIGKRTTNNFRSTLTFEYSQSHQKGILFLIREWKSTKTHTKIGRNWKADYCSAIRWPGISTRYKAIRIIRSWKRFSNSLRTFPNKTWK